MGVINSVGRACSPSRCTFVITAGAAVTAAVLALMVPASASAHGSCSQGYWAEHRSAVLSTRNNAYTKVWGAVRFGCKDSEQHAKVSVRVRLYRCRRVTYYCDGPLNFIAEAGKTCTTAIACITETAHLDCAEGYLFVAYGRWAAYNTSGERVHQNSNWPGYKRELPSPIGGTIGIAC